MSSPFCFRSTGRAVSILQALLYAAVMYFGTVYSADAAPLLMEGKKTLYQRVVSHPAAQLFASATGADIIQPAVKTFSVFYVFARQDNRVQVGSTPAAPQGWLDEAATTPWNQALTLLFTPRTARDPVLFFNTEEKLDQLCSADDMEQRLAALQKQAAGNTLPGGSGVIAAEPDDSKGAVSRNRFYLMPILAMHDPYEGVKFLQVASIDPGSGKLPSASGAAAQGGVPRTGIAFVIDTSISMKPYIDKSLEVIRSVYDGLAKGNQADNVGFAVVAFRNSTEARPELGYTSTVVSNFVTVKDRAQLEKALGAVDEAHVSTHSFNEDSLAGVKTALDSLDWDGYDSRLLILISDAGPLPSSDKYASVAMGAPEMNDYARSKGVWITAIHVRSPGGVKNHAYAESSYKKLTKLSSGGSNYLAIPAPTAAEGAKSFASATKALTSSIVNTVAQTASGKIVTRPKATAQPADPAQQATRLAQALGYAMQLEYLGKQRKNQAPHVVNAWIADTDLRLLSEGHHAPAVEVAVLLTKNQLSDLSQQISLIIDNAERTKKTDSRDFFQGILSASTRMARDPNAPVQGKNLAELGVLGEFLDGLPYKSDVMLLREEDWYRMSIGEQTAFINRLKSRLARYAEYDKDTANWESFGSSNPGEWVYRVPLAVLP